VKGNEDIKKNWGKVVRRCNQFLASNPTADIVWIKRNANRAAHVLAN
ncbi:hypothetical protein A2U01_0091258, partial [Trifolium medium]|nr:hypothetical protein [Trifolium medium]